MDSVDYPIGFANGLKCVGRHIRSLRGNLIGPLGPDHRDLRVERSALPSSFPLERVYEFRGGVEVPYQVVVVGGGDLRDYVDLGFHRGFDPGRDRVRADGITWIVYYARLFDGQR